MTLAEALKASKYREAISRLPDGTTVWATDAGVIFDDFLVPNKSWVDLLPEERLVIGKLDWIPSQPKSPLQQLADALTDWTDD